MVADKTQTRGFSFVFAILSSMSGWQFNFAQDVIRPLLFSGILEGRIYRSLVFKELKQCFM